MSSVARERRLASLFDPRSVAVVGASRDSRKWGHWLARGALIGQHRRAVFLINQNGGEVLDQPTFRTLDDLPEAPELVVLAIRGEGLEEAVEAAVRSGARAVLAVCTWDVATQRAGRADAALGALARERGVALLGPNSMGIFDGPADLHLASDSFPIGEIGMVSQSGNLAIEMSRLARRAGLGFSRVVSLGNQADVDAAEVIRDLASHDQTRVIAVYVEDFRDGRELSAAMQEAEAAGKPVIVLAVPTTQAADRAARSHTGAIVSDLSAVQAACDAIGADVAHTPQELVDLADGLLRAARLRGRRLGVVADGGGHGRVAASLAAQAGLDVPAFTPALMEGLAGLLPDSASVANPIDLAGAAERDISVLVPLLTQLMASGELDAILMSGYFGGYGQYDHRLGQAEAAAAAELTHLPGSGCPMVLQSMYSDSETAQVLRAGRVSVFDTIERSLSVLSRLAAQRTPTGSGVPAIPAPASPILRFEYEDARALLADAGIEFAAARVAPDAPSACAAARQIGYPVVLKALGLVHKSEGGGVVLGLADEAAVRSAAEDLTHRLAPRAFSVEHQAPTAEGIELIVGTRWDPAFGPVVLVGLGGVYTEILGDVVVGLAPIAPEGAEDLLLQLKAAPMLLGARGRPALDLGAAADVVARVSGVAAAHPELAEVEINPLLVLPSGAIALDARVIPTRNPLEVETTHVTRTD